MTINTLLWVAGATLLLITLGQWIVLRSRYLDGLHKQRTRHAQQLQTAGQHIDQARRQIAQLQLDLTGARSQLARIASRQSQAPAPARPADDAQAARREAGVSAKRGEPFDGFADTLPALQYPHDPSVLSTYPRSH